MIKVYGPYTRKQDGRQHVILYDTETQTRTTVSYPKYLVEQKLGRKLGQHEEVDHIDRDFTNNHPDNLQVLTKAEHRRLDAIYVKPIDLVCDWCGESYQTNANQFLHNKLNGARGKFCSKSCSGKYTREVQLGKRPPVEFPEIPDREYYRLSK